MSLDALKKIIERHWGFPTLRPLQEQAMRAVLDGRDSVVVMPTGGGKSLCYQAPAVLRGDTTVVVSPLISLMKDQVDSLQACGVPAIQIDSSQTDSERYAYELDVRQGAVRLLFVSPERLQLPGFQSLLKQLKVRTFAIDEAHCISHWGHDFRPEYRQIRQLRDHFPDASFHAYTATATKQVRDDIIAQLRLKSAEVLVGNFDRPNLTYRVLPRRDLMKQVLDILNRHPKEAGIIYCIRRKDVDELTTALKAQGHDARPYHAGMAPEDRKATQDAFAQEQCDLVVATVAFGMGIDRSNVRFVLHTGMPKSVEHYQQESGRAGRDSLEAECVLLHSGADFMTWKFILEKSAAEPDVAADFLPNSMKHLNDIMRYCTGAVCRHKALVTYFGQAFAAPSCNACDLCLGDVEIVPESVVVAQKILSCVARVKESFGVQHVAHILHGRTTEGILKYGHDKLTTFGLLKDEQRQVIQEWIRQLIGQEVLTMTDGDYPVLKLNPGSWEVMRKERAVRLVRPAQRAKDETPKKGKAETVSWEGVDRDLFDALRGLRRQVAEEKSVPPYVVFSDATLRELARIRPSSLERMRSTYGIGDAKLRDFGDRFLTLLKKHCREHSLSLDAASEEKPASKAEAPSGEVDWWAGVDRPLFNALRILQSELAEERRVPTNAIFTDATLRELARMRPSSMEQLRLVPGVGEAKLDDLGGKFLAIVIEHCRQRGLTQNQPPSPRQPAKPRSETPRAVTERTQAYELFRQGMSIADVAERTQWSHAKVAERLCEFITDERPASLATWMPQTVYDQVKAAARRVGTDRLKPIYVMLGERVSYDAIRLVLAHLEAEKGEQEAENE